MSVVVRFPPSPTGPLHVGGARTALFNYLFAKQNGGKFVLRFENTDRERSKPEYEKSILDSFTWLQLDFDKTYRQSERTHIYKTELERLLKTRAIYVSKETEGRAEVIRFRNPDRVITFTDLIRGKISFDTTELGDFVVARSIEEPLYHFAVVVDDWKMDVTHIIRGEDHISNTPRQILIQEALGASRPIYAHIPLILAPDRSKLSKRHGAVSVTEYREQGYLSDALTNYLALLGWNPGTDQEIFSRAELIKQFSLERIQHGGAIFDLEKLKWLNREYLRLAPLDIWENIFSPEWSTNLRQTIIPILRERVSTLIEAQTLITNGEYDYFRIAPVVDRNLLKDSKTLAKTSALLESIPEPDFNAERIKMILWPHAEAMGKAAVLGTLRVALSGREQTPDPFTIANILGKPETLNRLRSISHEEK